MNENLGKGELAAVAEVGAGFQNRLNRIAYGAPDPQVDINDEFFVRDLDRLKVLRSFLIQQAVGTDVQKPASLAFGALNRLKFHPAGRMPTEAEWSQIEELTQKLFGMLTPPLRHKFLMGAIPWWLTSLPVVFGATAVISLILAVIASRTAQNPGPILPYYILWLGALGATGSIAFIGMNALSIQDDATFDLTNGRLMVLRIAIGALFGSVLSLPLGYIEFFQFTQMMAGVKDPVANGVVQITMLLLPFVLGFSTSLVIMILNQLVGAVQSFFGKKGSPAGP
jgi:hypothetical protein